MSKGNEGKTEVESAVAQKLWRDKNQESRNHESTFFGLSGAVCGCLKIICSFCKPGVNAYTNELIPVRSIVLVSALVRTKKAAFRA